MIGDLDVRASLEAPSGAADGGGGFAAGWSEVADLWIGVTPLSAEETWAADRLESRCRYRVILRRREDVAAGMRLVTAARAFSILAVEDAGPRAPILTLLCEDAS